MADIEWHTCDNDEPPPPGGQSGDGGVESGWGHVSWMRSKSGGPGSGRTGRMKIKLPASQFVTQDTCSGTWIDELGTPYPFPAFGDDELKPSVMIGPNGARVRWPPGEVFSALIGGWARLYVEVAASTTITWSAMYAGGVSVPINEMGDDRWWNQYPPTHLGPYNIRSVSPGAQTIAFPNDGGAFFSNGGINAIGFDGFDLSWDTPGAVTRVCVAEFGEIS